MNTQTRPVPGSQTLETTPADKGFLRRSEIDPGTDYAPPEGPVEARLAGLWQEILRVDRVGRLDSFFELGGDSLQAIELFVRVEAEFGVALAPSTIIDHPTVARLSSLLSGNTRRYSERCLVPLQAEGAEPALFLVHEASGNLFSYAALVRRLGPGRRIYGLQYPGQDQDPIPVLTIPEMAATYVDAIKRAQAAGPYCLAGYSFGGAVAYEMARLLTERGDQIALLVLIDAGTADGNLTRLQRFARKLSVYLAMLSEEKPARWASHVLSALRKEAETLRARRRPRNPQNPLPEFVPQKLARLMSETLMSAHAAYTPPPYDGPVRVLRCTRGIAARWGPRGLGWADRAKGGLEVFDIPADHYSALSEPTVALVAAHLHQWLEQSAKGRAG